jgi:non-specific serine/threonine protein kinase
LTLVLSPRGHLLLEDNADAAEFESGLVGRLRAAFARDAGHGLLRLGAGEVRTVLPPELTYWRDFGGHYVTALCGQAGGDEANLRVPVPAANELTTLVLSAPPMTGGEYLTPTVLAALWNELGAALAVELRESAQSLAEFLKSLNPAWNLVGRVHFNLAKNRRDESAPFAFFATYTTRLSAQGKAQHLPLGQALREYAGVANRERLLSLLVPV